MAMPTDRIPGPTPVGGAYAIAEWTTDARDTGEITEFDEDDNELQRTYVGDSHPAPWDHAANTGTADLAIESQDGPKLGTWDLWHVEGLVWEHPIRTLEELLNHLAPNADRATQRQEVMQLMELPAWTPAPQTLKDEVYAWLGER